MGICGSEHLRHLPKGDAVTPRYHFDAVYLSWLGALLSYADFSVNMLSAIRTATIHLE